MDHKQLTQGIQGVVVLLYGIVIASSLANNDKPNNLAGLYYQKDVIPPEDAFNKAYENYKVVSTAAVVLNTKRTLDPFCLTPIQKPYPDASIYTSPVCMCLYKVLDATAQKDNMQSTAKAYNACYNTHQYVPVLKPQFGDNPTITDPQSRKAISRSGIVLVLCGGLLFHLIYSMIPENSTNNWMYLFLLVVCMLFIFFAPFFGSNAPALNNIAGLQGIFFATAAAEGLLIEYLWAWIYNHRRRVSYIHPYVFLVTFLALIQMAMIENGVFSWDVLFSHFWTGQSLTFAYAAILFFLHYGCGRQEDGPDPISSLNSTKDIDKQTMNGYFTIILSVGLTVVLNVIPIYPTANDTLNFAWALPWLFVCVAFMIPIFIEHMLDGPDQKQENSVGLNNHIARGAEERLATAAYWGNILYLSILIIAISYYLMIYLHLEFGSRFLSQRGTVGSYINFGLPVRLSNRAVSTSPLIYVTP